VNELDRDQTAFITRKGQFRFTTMPQGCANNPSMFSRLMSMVLKGLTWITCLVYIDDTIVIGSTFEKAYNNVQEVLNRFRQAKLLLKPTKTKLFQLHVKFLGHIISRYGIEPSEDKTACIVSQDFPRTISELRGFTSLCSYYRAFCPNFAAVAEPLTECLRKGVTLECAEKRLHAFNELIRFITTASVLSLPRDQCDDCVGEGCCGFVVDYDSSHYSAAAVLQQWQDGTLRVIEYGSRTFNHAERQYCVTRREMAIVIFALRHFKCYLLGHRRFTIRFGHMALLHYKTTPDPIGQQARHLDFVSIQL